MELAAGIEEDRRRAADLATLDADIAILGVGAYRTAFGRPRAALGRQDETMADASVWVLPNPSGLNANYQLPALVKLFRTLWQRSSKSR